MVEEVTLRKHNLTETIDMAGINDQADELRAKLFNLRETRPASHIYLLLNNACPVALEHPLHPIELDKRPVKRERAQLSPQAATATAVDEWQPFVLQFYRAGENGYVDEELLDLALNTALAQCTSINGAYVAAWIASELEPKSLALRLASNCELFDSHHGRRHRIPLYEPHRMALLLDEPEAQLFLNQFLKQLHLWAFIGAAGELRAITSVDQASTQDAPMARHLSLALCRAQARTSLARLAMLGLVKSGAPMPSHAERRIDALLVSADKLGLSHEEDVIFFVLNGLTLSALWHEHPQARNCIERSRVDGAPLAGLMAQLTDEMLDEIGHHGADH